MSDVTDTDREKALAVVLKAEELFDDTLTDDEWRSVINALVAAGWRPGGAPVAPDHRALIVFLYCLEWIESPDRWAHCERLADALRSCGLFGERREDVQAEALEAWVARVRDELAATDDAAIDLGAGYRHGLNSALAQAMGRAAELRKAAQS